MTSISGDIKAIPTLELPLFHQRIRELLSGGGRLVSFFGSPGAGTDGRPNPVHLNAVISRREGSLEIIRTSVEQGASFQSLTPEFQEFHCFEREVYEQYSLKPNAHPWLKPIRFSNERPAVEDYPFYKLDGKEVHEVGVGPIHAGVIEPGHFRFMCYGETVRHLEIQLGYQHRGVERLLLERPGHMLAPLVETISGDSSIAHTWAYCMAWENLCDAAVDWKVDLARGVGLELERIAMHLAGLSGMATDIAFLPGGSTYGRLRTTVINSSMRLCGSRFGRGWLRPGETRSRLSADILGEVETALKRLEADLRPINDLFLSSKSVQHRLKETGKLSPSVARNMGFVGMAARSTGIALDLRNSAESGLYSRFRIESVVEVSGDCWARAVVRIREIEESLKWLFSVWPSLSQAPNPAVVKEPAVSSFSLALVEGWRGEVMHYLETDEHGKLSHYKVQDPSLRNWFGLALAVRENDISDFPICNKSFDLSYCGQDL